MTFTLSPALRALIAAGAMFAADAAIARTFISPMGEPFRSMPGGKEPSEAWFEGVDKNGDGRITRAEFLADAGRFFIVLDTNHDREIGPEEIEHYEEDVAPEVQSSGLGDIGAGRHGSASGGRRGRRRPATDSSEVADGSDAAPAGPAYDESGIGASRFSYLDLPEPVSSADTDFNRGVSIKEFADAASARFTLLDANQDGVITRDDLPHMTGALLGGRGGHDHRPSRPPPGDPPRDGGN